MAKRSYNEGNWRTDPWFRALCKALAACETEAEVANFLRDVGTLTELQAWSERFEVAKQIANKKTYRDISDSTGASTTTITRVARFLQSGEGGYRRSLNAKHHHHPAASRAERMASTVRK
ncbi:MAG: YerC/YecD family TrpR-related protein [Candidatus Peregrinibacteria bacterium]|nr:YerC/YecD family TrpR-related protein [Candidatus Peregrinibacteria bacterium]